MFFIQCTYAANKASNNVMCKLCAKHCHGFETWICEFQNGECSKQIANHWPDSAVTNIHCNVIELIGKLILAGDGWTELRVYWLPK